VANGAVWSLEYFNRTDHLHVLDPDAHGRTPSI
jgi:hypothetical protein